MLCVEGGRPSAHEALGHAVALVEAQAHKAGGGLGNRKVREAQLRGIPPLAIKKEKGKAAKRAPAEVNSTALKKAKQARVPAQAEAEEEAELID